MGAKTTTSFEDAKNDVKTAIKNERMQEAQKAVSEISTTTLNDAYFGRRSRHRLLADRDVSRKAVLLLTED